LNELHEKYAKDGLVIIGIHSMRGGEKMASFAKEKKISYPIAHDWKGKTTAKYHVDGYPDYHVIDRSGKVRIADMKNGEIDRVVAALLKEKGPSKKAKDKEVGAR